LRGEYLELYKDVAKDITWARIALGQEPDAINLWIGNSRSVTALHKDNYENLYCQVVGSKNFVLLPPVEMACVNEKQLACATYAVDDLSVSMLQLLIHTPRVSRLTVA
jgi:peptidyl-lysine (3S)-dioxygenase / protease